MTPRKPLTELEADEFVCVRCGTIASEHPLDGMDECLSCASAGIHPWSVEGANLRFTEGTAWKAEPSRADSPQEPQR